MRPPTSRSSATVVDQRIGMTHRSSQSAPGKHQLQPRNVGSPARSMSKSGFSRLMLSRRDQQSPSKQEILRSIRFRWPSGGRRVVMFNKPSSKIQLSTPPAAGRRFTITGKPTDAPASPGASTKPEDRSADGIDRFTARRALALYSRRSSRPAFPVFAVIRSRAKRRSARSTAKRVRAGRGGFVAGDIMMVGHSLSAAAVPRASADDRIRRTCSVSRTRSHRRLLPEQPTVKEVGAVSKAGSRPTDYRE